MILTEPRKRPKTIKPPTKSLPPIVVELPLFDLILAKAAAEGRTLSDVVRCAIRDSLKDDRR